MKNGEKKREKEMQDFFFTVSLYIVYINVPVKKNKLWRINHQEKFFFTLNIIVPEKDKRKSTSKKSVLLMQREKWHKYFVCLIVSKSSTVKKIC